MEINLSIVDSCLIFNQFSEEPESLEKAFSTDKTCNSSSFWKAKHVKEIPKGSGRNAPLPLGGFGHPPAEGPRGPKPAMGGGTPSDPPPWVRP